MNNTRIRLVVLTMMDEDLGLHSSQATTQPDNIRSQRVLERNGFSQVGIVHEHIFLDGAWRDCIL